MGALLQLNVCLMGDPGVAKSQVWIWMTHTDTELFAVLLDMIVCACAYKHAHYHITTPPLYLCPSIVSVCESCLFIFLTSLGFPQLLKHVASISPRGVYTSGKGSRCVLSLYYHSFEYSLFQSLTRRYCSGVGLTAAVVRDPLTGEFVLEVGHIRYHHLGLALSIQFIVFSLLMLFQPKPPSHSATSHT